MAGRVRSGLLREAENGSMRPSRLVTYQVCRPGEGSVPGRPGLVVAVGTVTAAMATMTAAMTTAVVVAHAVAHHTVAHHAAAGLDTEFLFHLVAEGHAFGAELGAEFRHLIGELGNGLGLGVGVAGQGVELDALGVQLVLNRGYAAVVILHHGIIGTLLFGRNRVHPGVVAIVVVPVVGESGHAGTENDGGKGESGDKSASLQSVYSSNGVFIERLKPNGLLSV